jgi:GNAT superfamily N-acetyltransferase
MKNSKHFIDQMEWREIRTPQETLQYEALLNESFSVPKEGSYFEDFPVWHPRFRQKAYRLGTFSRESGELLSAASVRIATLHANARSQRPRPSQVAILGGVVTAPHARGQGLASHAIQLLLTWATEQGAERALLWGSDTAFYERLGFRSLGFQLRVALQDLELGAKAHHTRIHTGWDPVLFGELRFRESGLLHSAQDEYWIEAHRNVEWYWIGSERMVEAYAAINRGIDLHGFVHEWGGETTALRELLAFLKSAKPDLQILAHPEHLSLLGVPPGVGVLEHLCLGRSLGRAEEISEEEASSFWIWGLDAA